MYTPKRKSWGCNLFCIPSFRSKLVLQDTRPHAGVRRITHSDALLWYGNYRAPFESRARFPQVLNLNDKTARRNAMCGNTFIMLRLSTSRRRRRPPPLPPPPLFCLTKKVAIGGYHLGVNCHQSSDRSVTEGRAERKTGKKESNGGFRTETAVRRRFGERF